MCVHVCVSPCACVCLCVCAPVSIYVCAHAHMCVCLWAYRCACMSVGAGALARRCTCECMCVCGELWVKSFESTTTCNTFPHPLLAACWDHPPQKGRRWRWSSDTPCWYLNLKQHKVFSFSVLSMATLVHTAQPPQSVNRPVLSHQYLIGLALKVPAWRAEYPGFKSRLGQRKFDMWFLSQCDST